MLKFAILNFTMLLSVNALATPSVQLQPEKPLVISSDRQLQDGSMCRGPSLSAQLRVSTDVDLDVTNIYMEVTDKSGTIQAVIPPMMESIPINPGQSVTLPTVYFCSLPETSDFVLQGKAVVLGQTPSANITLPVSFQTQ